ncbi:MAG: uridine kinase [Desulfotalea sp.]|nr:MAG: uridine kinase [Desulfotalea sp.]
MKKICRRYRKPQVIGIIGGSGSVKATLCQEVIKFCNEDIVLLSQDSYFKDFGQLSQAKRNAINFEHTDAIDAFLLLSHLQSLKQSASIEVPEYDFATHSRSGRVRVLHSASIIIVEGILLFALPQIRALYDYRVFVHMGTDKRFIRRMRRDIKLRGANVRSAVRQYLGPIKPRYNRYTLARSATADLIINGLNLRNALKQISNFITTIQENNYETKNIYSYAVLQPRTFFGINNSKHP